MEQNEIPIFPLENDVAMWSRNLGNRKTRKQHPLLPPEQIDGVTWELLV